MKKYHLISLFILVLLFSSGIQSQTNQRKTMSPTRAYVDVKTQKQDLLFPDYVVLFAVPDNASTFVVQASGRTEQNVLGNSLIDTNWRVNGQRYVKVLSGWRARNFNNYRGSINQWAASLSLEYLIPFQPRGNQPVQPRGPAPVMPRGNPSPTPTPAPRRRP